MYYIYMHICKCVRVLVVNVNRMDFNLKFANE